jgi:hypothetical protein
VRWGVCFCSLIRFTVDSVCASDNRRAGGDFETARPSGDLARECRLGRVSPDPGLPVSYSRCLPGPLAPDGIRRAVCVGRAAGTWRVASNRVGHAAGAVLRLWIRCCSGSRSEVSKQPASDSVVAVKFSVHEPEFLPGRQSFCDCQRFWAKGT